MGGVGQWLRIASLPAPAALRGLVGVSRVLFVMMRWGTIAGAGSGGTTLVQEFPDQIEGVHGKSDLAEEDSLDSDDCDDSKEEGYQSSQLQFQEEKDGEELLQLLLLLATGWKKKPR